MTFEITEHDYHRLLGIAVRVARNFGVVYIAEDFCQEYIADLIDGRFEWDGKTTHPYKIMMHYYRLWEKPRTASLTKESYWKHILRKPIIPSDYFELKELWESATEVERSGIFALMMHYGVVKDKGRKSQADKNALCKFRKRHGISISRNSVSVSTRQKRRKRLREAS